MEPKAHHSSHLHVTGTATFIDDIIQPANALQGYVVTSEIAYGQIKSIDIQEALKTQGVVSILSFKDIPGINQMGPLRDDEPILAESTIEFYGQALFLIAATSIDIALKAAQIIKIETEPLPPILTIEEAMDKGWQMHPTLTIERGNITKAFSESDFCIEDELTSGGQEHWYLETQIAAAIPFEDNTFKVYSSTQHPAETQTLIAQALGLNRNAIVVETNRLGGGFGGKETQANMVAIWASLLANATRQPVKIRLNRIQDQSITGKRHPFKIKFKVGFNNQGIIHAYHVHFHANAGYSLDLTLPVLARARTHAENAYFIPNIKIESTPWKTNLPSNTAFRGFGAPQAIYAIEYVIELIAKQLKIDPAEVRFRNFYKELTNNVTPYGQMVENNQLQNIYKQLIAKSGYSTRCKEIDIFNSNNEYKKRGVATVPVKFGISFNTPFLNQAGALVNIYTDGSVLINHGGIEMGQGIHSKIAIVASKELGIPINKIKISSTTTATIPNTSATAASSGTDLNGMATYKALQIIKRRLGEYLNKKWDLNLKDEKFADYFIYNDRSVSDPRNTVNTISFSELVKEAYLSCISLSAQGYYVTPGLHFDREKQQGHPFHYFTCGMSVSEVEVDLLTGNIEIIRTDILHDAGNSIHPEIDKGQIAGAFIQGSGWCTTEELKWNDFGKLLTNSPDTYKIPGVRNIPETLNIALLTDSPNPQTIHNSKAIGEPPFIYGLSVFFAVNNAINSINASYNDKLLMIPATNEKILQVIVQLIK